MLFRDLTEFEVTLFFHGEISNNSRYIFVNYKEIQNLARYMNVKEVEICEFHGRLDFRVRTDKIPSLMFIRVKSF